MIRVALIGCGEHSRHHHASAMAHHVLQNPGEVELSAVCDLDRDKAEGFAREFGFARAYDDPDRMIADESPDGIVCVMPIHKIAEMGERLLDMGIPCVIEKPLGGSIDQARKLAQAAARTGAAHMVSVNRRFTPLLVRGVDWSRGQGDIQLVRALMTRVARREAGFAWGTGIHAVDTMRWICGQVTGFDAARIAGEGMSAPWYTVSMTFGGEQRGNITVARTSGVLEETYELFGEGYCARVTVSGPDGPRLQCWKAGELDLDVSPPHGEPQCVTCGAYGEFRHFVDSLKNRRPLGPTIADVLGTMEICAEIPE